MIARYACLCAVLAHCPASGTECIEISQRQAARHASLIFQGRVTKVEDVGDVFEKSGGERVATLRVSDSAPQVVTFAVDQVWKGPVVATVRVFGFRHPTFGHGYTFVVGREYVVYTPGAVSSEWQPLRPFTTDGLLYEIGDCPLRVRTDIATERRSLGKGKKPQWAKRDGNR